MPTKLKKEFGKNLKQRLLLEDMSQREFAKIVGVNERVISQWLTGKSSPTFDRLPAIAKALKCEIYQLFLPYNFSEEHDKTGMHDLEKFLSAFAQSVGYDIVKKK